MLIPVGLDEGNLAEPARVDDLLAEDPVIPASLLRPGLHDLLRRLDRLHHLGAFLDGVRDRLLDVDVLAGGDGLEGDGLVPVIRRADHDGIDSAIVQDAAVVADLDRRRLRRSPRPGASAARRRRSPECATPPTTPSAGRSRTPRPERRSVNSSGASHISIQYLYQLLAAGHSDQAADTDGNDDTVPDPLGHPPRHAEHRTTLRTRDGRRAAAEVLSRLNATRCRSAARVAHRFRYTHVRSFWIAAEETPLRASMPAFIFAWQRSTDFDSASGSAARVHSRAEARQIRMRFQRGHGGCVRHSYETPVRRDARGCRSDGPSEDRVASPVTVRIGCRTMVRNLTRRRYWAADRSRSIRAQS